MHFNIEKGAFLTVKPEANYNAGWSEVRELVREAVTVRREPTPDQEGYHKCLMIAKTGAFPNYRSIQVPRGFLPALEQGLTGLGHTYTLSQDLNDKDAWSWGKTLKLRPHQEDAVAQILSKKEGIILAPPGAGKTILTLEAIRRTGRRALIIVDKKNLIDQWDDRCAEFLNLSVDIIGGDKDSINGRAITVAMQQTLYRTTASYSELHDYGFVCLDECHHVTADTYLNVFQKYAAEYRIGLSATPYRNDGLDMISRLVIGPVIYQVTSEDLLRNKYLVKPKIIRVKTTFTHPFWGTHNATNGICDVPGCKKQGTRHGHRNNYQKVTKALVEDKSRNTMIALDVANNRNYCNLIVSDRLEHLNQMRELSVELGFPAERTHMLTGKETPLERAEVSRLAAYGACAIFSTIAKEALDIPRLDRIYLTWPIKREHILEQQIGRIARTHPDKVEAIVYDYVDEETSVLSHQARSRLSYYHTKNYEIKDK